MRRYGSIDGSQIYLRVFFDFKFDALKLETLFDLVNYGLFSLTRNNTYAREFLELQLYYIATVGGTFHEAQGISLQFMRAAMNLKLKMFNKL